MDRIGTKVCAIAWMIGAMLALCAGTATAAGYHSPGYTGTTSFRNVVVKPLPPITLGVGKKPDLLVDASGTAHVVYAQDGGSDNPDMLAFCNIQRGIKTCASQGTAPNPTPNNDPGNFPAGNHDFDGPVPLAIGNQLFLIDRRFPDVFTTPDGSDARSNVFEWSSTDGGATPTGPGFLGDNQMAGGAVAFGSPDAPSIGTISRGQTEGTFFQGTLAGAYTTAKAQLGSAADDQDGSLAVDGTRPVAAFDNTSGQITVREFSGSGDPNDPSNWSTSTLPGYAPQIVGGAAGVFLLSSDSDINGGHLTLRRIVNGVASGAAVSLGTSVSPPSISEDAQGNLSFAYTDPKGIEVRTSNDGVSFGAAQLAAAVSPYNVGNLVTASAGDGGGFVSYIKDGTGAENVGQVMLSAFGTQAANGLPGLGPLPGGGIGSAAGDQLATSTCTTAGFGLVKAVNVASCWAHAPGNPNLDVSLGEVDINGLRIIPDGGVRIGIDPRQHTIDTSGSVRVVLTAAHLNITLYHGTIHAHIPDPDESADLFDFVPDDFAKGFLPDVAGFPINGSIDAKLVKGGVQIPISLKMPSYFGGVTGSVTLKASYPNKLDVTSIDFTIGDLNLAALELKKVDVMYDGATDTWKGQGELQVPSGGSALDANVSVTFKDGDFAGGQLDLALPYPGIPLDPPDLYMSHGGLGFSLHPLTLTGTLGLGFQPLLPPTKGGLRDFVFSLDGSLTASFGNPVTFTAQILGGYLYKIQIVTAKLVYQVPDTVTLNANASLDLGIVGFTGNMAGIFDPKHHTYGGSIDTEAYIDVAGHRLNIPSVAFAFNNHGFAGYIPYPGVGVVPYTFFGTIGYQFGSDAHLIIKYGRKDTSRFKPVIPASGARAADGGTSFTIPKGAPSANLVVNGQGGAPSVTLIAPNGQTVTADGQAHDGMQAMAIPDASDATTFVGIVHPAPGRWQVVPAAGSSVALGSVSLALGVKPPKVSGHLSGRGSHRALHYRVSLPSGFAVSFVERTNKVLRTIGSARGASGVIHFSPGPGPAGRRQVVAQITDDGLPNRSVTLGSYVVPRPPKPGRAHALKVRGSRRSFTYRYRAPANAARVLITLVTSDGRHLQRMVSAASRGGSLPALGFTDTLTVSVVGIGRDGRRGPSVRAKATRSTIAPARKHRRKRKR